jgi:hypothetical protein
MSAESNSTSAFSTPRTSSERVELANQLYQHYRAQCFWHCPSDLVITEEMIPFVVEELRAHGDRQAFILSGKLRPLIGNPQRELPECR